jgi:hypothetical protein
MDDGRMKGGDASGEHETHVSIVLSYRDSWGKFSTNQPCRIRCEFSEVAMCRGWCHPGQERGSCRSQEEDGTLPLSSSHP